MTVDEGEGNTQSNEDPQEEANEPHPVTSYVEPVAAASSELREESSGNNQDSPRLPGEESEAEVAHTDVPEPAPPAPPKKLEWYVVHAYSGFEMKAKQSLEERIRQYKMQDFFGEIHVPEETVVELVRGQKKTSTRKFFPGYLLVQMVLNEDTWHLVKETPKITGFVGDAREPQPVTEEEISRVRSQVEEGATSPRARMNFEQGEAVKVIDGPFADFNGTVEEVKPEKGKVKVLISIFGRATPVELDFVQIEKC